MKYKLVLKSGNLISEYSSEEIQQAVDSPYSFELIDLKEYMMDENGNIVGIKGLADHGHGYGFNYGWKEFNLRVGEEYSFFHEFTSIEGPSDWSCDSAHYTLKLVEEN